MKQIRKSFLFSNFKNDISKFTTTNELTINSIQNLTLENNIIEPTFNFSLLTDKLIEKGKREDFYTNNMSVINETLLFEIYEYYDSDSNNFIKRLFAIRKDLYLYEYDTDANVLINKNYKFSTLPKIFQKDNCMYFYSKGNDLLCIKNNELLFYSNSQHIDDFCVHNNYIFYTIISRMSKFSKKFSALS